MKKLTALMMAAALALAASADSDVKLGTLLVTDQAGLVKATAQLAGLAGNPMLGVMASTSIASFPVYKHFGPMRENSQMLFVAYGEALEDDFDDIEGAVLYPPQRTKIAFMAEHPGCYEKDGVIVIEERNATAAGDDDDGDDDDDSSVKRTYTAFSEDGQWATMSNDKDAALRALGEVAQATAPLNGEIARLTIFKDVFQSLSVAIGKGLQHETNERKKATMMQLKDRVNMIDTVTVGLKITEAGGEISGTFVPVAGTELATVGREPLAAAPLAFAPAQAIFAAASAKGSGERKFDATQYGALVALLEKHGVMSDYCTCAFADDSANMTIDIAKAIAFFKGPGAEKASVIDPESFVEEMGTIFNSADQTPIAEQAGGAISLTLANHPAAVAPEAKFNALFPEAASLQPFTVSVGSYYELVKALATEAVPEAPEEIRPTITTILSTLPPAGNAAIANVYYRSGDTILFTSRISVDELRGIGAIVNAAVGFVTAQMMN